MNSAQFFLDQENITYQKITSSDHLQKISLVYAIARSFAPDQIEDSIHVISIRQMSPRRLRLKSRCSSIRELGKWHREQTAKSTRRLLLRERVLL